MKINIVKICMWMGALSLFWTTIGQAQSAVKVLGKVIDAKTNHELVGANIIVQSTAMGAVSDAQGRFAIENLLNGSYTLRADYMGYESAVQAVRISDGEPELVVFRLQPNVLHLRDVSITAERFSAPHELANFAVNLDRKYIEQSHAENTAQLLQQVSGVQITETGAAGSVQKISIRGSHSNQVLVFVDGVKMNDETTGEVDLSLIPLQHIENVSIQKGAASAIYGNGAIGGAIYISTIQRNQQQLSLNTTLGPFGYVSVEPFVNGQINRFFYTFSYQSVQSQGNYPYTYRTADDLPQHVDRINADLFSQNGFARLGYAINNHQLSMRSQYFTARRGLPGKVNYWTRYARAENTRHLYQVDYQYTQKLWLLKADIYSNTQQTENANLWPADAALIDRMYPRYQLQNTLTTRGAHAGVDFSAKWYAAKLGVEVKNSQYKDNNLLAPASTKIGNAENVLYAAYLQQALHLQKQNWHAIIEPAVRFDYAELQQDENRLERQVSPGVQAFFSYGDVKQLYIKGGVQHAYRLPTFTDLFYQDFRVQGQPNLLPEKSTNVEMGGGFRWHAAHFEFMHFQYNVDDMIVWRLGSFEVFRPYNTDAAMSGQEYTLSLASPEQNFLFDASYTHVLGLNKNENQTLYNKLLPYKPKDSLKLAVTANWRQWNSALQYRYTGERFVTEANTVSMPAFAVWDASLQRSLNIRRLQLDLRIQLLNAFDARYEIIRDMPLPGREWRLGIFIQYH